MVSRRGTRRGSTGSNFSSDGSGGADSPIDASLRGDKSSRRRIIMKQLSKVNSQVETPPPGLVSFWRPACDVDRAVPVVLAGYKPDQLCQPP